ncbi:MAG: nucleotidyltransferase family protein [Oscillospiraceae bacterium]|nr:nucleotidyltransferase family protein [Oscillospiraceae bacterium]
MLPGIANLMCKLDIDRDFWAQQLAFYTQRNQRIVECLDEMYCLLAQNGIDRIAVVENFGALLASGKDISVFGSGDVDEYVDPQQQEKLYEVLLNAGYKIQEHKAGNILISTRIDKDTFPEGFYLGVNWDVTTRLNLPRFSAKGDFIDWDRAMYYRDTCVRLPSPEGLMYVCLMHIAVHGFCREPDIRLYYDIANAAQQPVDWETVIRWAKRDKNCVKIATAAYLSHKLVDVDIPEDVFAIANRKQMDKLLRVVYDEKENILNESPGKLDRVLVEMYTNDRSALQGLLSIVFPPYAWIKGKYQIGILGYVKHLFKLR